MRSLVLHPDIPGRDLKRAPGNALDEAVSLASALDEIEVIGARIVRLPKPHSGLLFGTGKVAELKEQIDADEIGLVIIDSPVSPVQQRNLERAWKVRVLDRTGLILEIFGARARTREGVLQVDLAALAYQRSRLVRSWTHLERQRGGLGFIGGAGETQIEADRRAIDDAIVRLKRQLEKVVKTRTLHRAARKKIPYPIVALVGYTNAGKSTIFNTMTGADVLAKDMLFATLDPTMRGVKLPSGREIILSDTVGFISDLPTQLVAAFRATLEEVLDADLILHVRDITHPESREQAADVLDILSDLGVDTKDQERLIEVWNKIDRAEPDHRAALVAAAERDPRIVATSALDGTGLDRLAAVIEAHLAEPVQTETLNLAFGDERRRAWLFQQHVVDDERQTETGYDLTVTWSDRQKNKFQTI
jgi:GTP-binding protein HflX